jgi:hypothetical protein
MELSGQLYKGQRTHIGWTARDIVLPMIPGSEASGATIKVAGGRPRFMNPVINGPVDDARGLTRRS